MIGKNILKFRKARNLTQDQLAEKAKVERSIISRIEKGKIPDPSFKKIVSISRALKVTVDELMGLRPKSRIVPLPVISKTIASPEGAYFTDQDFAVGAGEEYYDISDPDAFILIVENDSMEPAIRAGSRVIVTPNKRGHSGDICVVRLAESGKTMLKRIEIQGDNVILKSDNPKYETKIFKQREVEWIYRVEAIIPK